MYFRQKVKVILNNNQSKQKIFFYYYFWKKKIDFQFYLRPVKEHKADCKNGKGAYMCGFHMYPKFFAKFLQI